VDLGAIQYYHFTGGNLADVFMMISRTGYTGEPGYEIMFPHEGNASRVWDAIFETAKPMGGLEPIGLGARDTLRLEMGYCLYGNDIDDTTSPLEAGIGWTVKLGKGDFVGREPLLKQKQQGVRRKLVGIELEGRRVARHAMVVEREGRAVGMVTSGSFSPSLQKP